MRKRCCAMVGWFTAAVGGSEGSVGSRKWDVSTSAGGFLRAPRAVQVDLRALLGATTYNSLALFYNPRNNIEMHISEKC